MSARRHLGMILFVLVLLFTGMIGAQQRGVEVPEESGLEERVEVRLVQITVLAVDESGIPVTDLRPEEVIIRDQGKPVRVAFLDRIERQPNPPVPARLFVDAPGGPTSPVSNNGGEPRHYILFIDIDNEPPLGREDTAESVTAFAAELFEPSDQVAVVAFNGEIHLETPFTSDHGEIVAAVASAFERPRRPRLDAGRRMRNLLMRLEACGGMSCIGSATAAYELETRSQGRDLIRALDGIVRYAGGLEGRKAVLAVSHGAALDPDYEVSEAINAIEGAGFAPPFGDGVMNLEMLDEVINLAVQQEVALHFVTQPPRGRDAYGAWAGTFRNPGARPFEAMQIQAQREMSQVAAATGGRLLVQDDAFTGLREAIDLERSSYALGYYLDRPPKPGKYRRLRLGTTRTGVEILGPRGHYRNRPPRKRLSGGLTLGEPYASEPPLTGWSRVPFTVSLSPEELGYRTKKGLTSTNLTMETMIFLDDGRSLARTYHFINHEPDVPKKKLADSAPVELHGWAELPPGFYELRIVVRNPRAGTEGRFTQPILLQ